MKESLVVKIVEVEWRMFSTVVNSGGPSCCQMDPATFEIMRHSQIGAWPEELQGCYLADLTHAWREGRNLMSEKYARMMEFTFPDEYREIAHRLPVIDEATRSLIEDIVAVNVEWKLEIADLYPELSRKGRPVRAHDDSVRATSFETYLRAELQTYSPQSIRILHAHTVAQKKSTINGLAVTLLNMVNRYGYTSLAQAERSNQA